MVEKCPLERSILDFISQKGVVTELEIKEMFGQEAVNIFNGLKFRKKGEGFLLGLGVNTRQLKKHDEKKFNNPEKIDFPPNSAYVAYLMEDEKKLVERGVLGEPITGARLEIVGGVGGFSFKNVEENGN